MASRIHIIHADSIDRLRWEECVRSSPNAVIYAYSFYLDQMADNWSGIVMGDYDAVMPVPWRKKMGIRYAYDVPFIQQLGWFSKNGTINGGLFLQQLFAFVKYGCYSFNSHNSITTKNISTFNNYIIPLSTPYQSIRDNYKPDALNNLKKAGRFNLSFKACNIETAIEMYRLAYQSRFTNTTSKDYVNFTALCNVLKKKELAFARAVVDEDSGVLLCVALFLSDSRRIYNIMNTTIEAGRTKGANHFLLDNVFKEFAGTGMVFDFEGSEIPGIKLFYEKFGAANQPYPRLQKFNRLSFPLNLLK